MRTCQAEKIFGDHWVQPHCNADSRSMFKTAYPLTVQITIYGRYADARHIRKMFHFDALLTHMLS